MSIRFLKFFFSHIFPKIDTPESCIVLLFSPEKLALLYLLKEVKPFLDHNIVIILVSASVLPKTYSRMKISFSSRLSDIGERHAKCWRGGKKEKGTAAPAILHIFLVDSAIHQKSEELEVEQINEAEAD